MATVYIENRPYDVEPSHNLLHVCLSLGLDLPYFCWHPALGSVGACRQCAVKQFRDEQDTRGRLVMACMTPAADGMRISIGDAEAQAFRASVIEWLMVNHPHDCPVCDEGGECHLQDMTLMTGHTYRRYRFQKRTYRNQYLGPFINHEMNRCIQCYVILENDLYRRASAGQVRAFLDSCQHVIVIDHLRHATTEQAEVVLPAGTFAEADGTLISSEGRAQRFFQVFVPGDEIQESWRWVRDIMVASGWNELDSWQNLDDILDALADELPAFAELPDLTPHADWRVAGLKIAHQSHRYSGRTAMAAHRNVHERRPPADSDAPLTFSMEGVQRQAPPPLIPLFWAPGWNSIQAVNKFQSEVGGPLRGGDPGRRLIEPAQNSEGAYFDAVPAAFAPPPGAWLLVPIYHLFGSEELSIFAPAVAERAPRPYLALNQEDARDLQVGPADEVELRLADHGPPPTCEDRLGVAQGACGAFRGPARCARHGTAHMV
jgi:NADH-quinone oxidoreductase subunit G